MAHLRLDRYPQYRKLAQDTQGLMRECLDGWPAEPRPGDSWDPLPLLVHSIVQSQSIRLDAALQLDVAGLAFTVTSFARLGYDEWLWLTYFASVPPGHREKLWITLSARELAKRYEAQRALLGTEGMRRIGFGEGAEEELRPQRDALGDTLAQFDEELGWNRGKGKDRLREPSLSRLADLTGYRVQHAYFVTAPSQFMHFSGWRAYRAISTTESGHAQHRTESVEKQDAGFALGWTAIHLLRTLQSIRGWDAQLGEVLDGARAHWDLVAGRLLRETEQFGEPPLLEAADIVRD